MTAFFNAERKVKTIEEMKVPFGKPAKRVKCIDPISGEIVADYESITEAAKKAVGKLSAKGPISNVCNGYQQTAYGFKWEFID